MTTTCPATGQRCARQCTAACADIGLRRVPLIAPGEARVFDLAQAAAARGCKLVHDGRRVYVTPRPMPGEFEVAA